MRKTIAFVAAISLIVASCATYEPVVDTKGVDQALYQQDLNECQAYAEKINPGASAVGGAGAGALLGALLGVIVGAAAGRPGAGAGFGAAYGAAVGGAGGLAGGAQTQLQIVERCLSQRGYKVLQWH